MRLTSFVALPFYRRPTMFASVRVCLRIAMCLAVIFASVVLQLTAAPEAAAATPDAAKLRSAADAFEEGARAFKDKRFEEAAAHFEAADANVPSPKALRWAIRSRTEAGQASRAATLALLALERHKDDTDTAKLATETLDRFALSLYKLQVHCDAPCQLAESGRVIHGEPVKRRSVYLEPGSIQVAATLHGTSAAEQLVKATAGGAGSIRFESPKDLPNPGKQPDPPAPKSGATPPLTSVPPAESWGANPGFFGFSLGSTLTMGGLLAWSGADAQSLPPASEVKRVCQGKKPEDCAIFQRGLHVETRTNVLLGLTIGTAVMTVVAAIVTDWGGDPGPKVGKDRADRSVVIRPLMLWVDGPSAMKSDSGDEDTAASGPHPPRSQQLGSGAGSPLGPSGTPVFGATGVF